MNNRRHSRENRAAILTDKPCFGLEVVCCDCAWELVFNGVYQYVNAAASRLHTWIPVNHWVRPGANELQLNVYAADPAAAGEQAFCRVSLQVRRSTEAPETAAVMCTLAYNGRFASAHQEGQASTAAGRYDSGSGFRADEQGDVWVEHWQRQEFTRAGINGISLCQRVSFSSSLPSWAFFSAAELPPAQSLSAAQIADLHASLYSQYEKIQQALASGRIAAIMPMLAERNRELEQAFYEPSGSRESLISQALHDAIDDPELSLVELRPQYVGLEFMPGRQLIRLARANAGPAIVFNYAGRNLSRAFEFLFYRHQDEWRLCR